MIQAHLADVGDKDPVAAEVDGVVVALVHRRLPSSPVGPLKRIFRPLALNGDAHLITIDAKGPEHGVSARAGCLDMFFPF